MPNIKKFKNNYKNCKIAIIGLGYVGLPLAIEFGKKRNVVGFDKNEKRVYQLKNGSDVTLETSVKDIKKSKKLLFSNNIKDVEDCKIYIVTVPTPVDRKNIPDLSLIKKASIMIGSILKKNDLVIYESTVYPGVTEEICAKILENKSGLTFNKDFYCGYSSERINPGDKEHRLTMIKKVTSGSTPEISTEVDKLYKEIISVGTHKAPSIKTAEAAKVIENIQRDVNIALVNELAKIFNKLNIDTKSVLDAAATKWNFMPFKPGLVGGHCISVDPYYLLHKALKVGFKPQMIIAGRKINNSMGNYIVKQSINLMKKKGIKINHSNVLILGFTFKENCPDIRNTRVIDLVEGLKNYNLNVDVYDPYANKKEVFRDYQIKIIDKPSKAKYNLIILAVGHNEFIKFTSGNIKKFGKKNCVVYDIKYFFNKSEVDGRI